MLPGSVAGRQRSEANENIADESTPLFLLTTAGPLSNTVAGMLVFCSFLGFHHFIKVLLCFPTHSSVSLFH